MTSGRFKAILQDGALALEFGWDPMKYLGLEGTERLIAQRILQEAVEQRAENQRNHWKNMQASIQNGVSRAFGAKK